MRLLGFLGLLVLLAVVVLGPSLSESRIVPKHELRAMIHKKLHLPKGLLKYKATIINIVVCEVYRKNHLRTDFINVLGTRVTTTTKPTTLPTTNTITTTTKNLPPTTNMTLRPKTTTTTTTLLPTTTTTTTTPLPTTTTTTTTPLPSTTTTPPLDMTTESTDSDESNSVEFGSRRRRSAVMDDEGSGMSMTMEDVLNWEEDKFDEEQMMRDDNTLDADSSEEDSPGACTSLSSQWSLGYHGIFWLSDSHFCCSGYRWSRNVCKTDCRAFTDDDISDDVDCLVKTGFWRFLLRTASYQCFPQYNTL